VTKFAKFIALCGVLFLLLCCILFGGCRKVPQQDGVSGTTSAVMDDADLNLEVETHGTVKSSNGTVKGTKQSTVKTSDGTVGSTKRSTVKTTNSTTKGKKPASSNDGTPSSDTTTVSTVTTTRTTQKGWSPDLGKKPQ